MITYIESVILAPKSTEDTTSKSPEFIKDYQNKLRMVMKLQTHSYIIC